MSNNPFGGNVFGAMWESVQDNTKARAEECKNIMKDTINEETGALRDSVEIDGNSDGSYQVGINQNKLEHDVRNKYNIDYTPYYYYGTRPHIIRARKGGMLHWQKNGIDHYAKQVRHPGTKPHNFIQDTLNQMK